MARTFTMAGLAVCACLAAPAFAQDFSVSSAGGDWVFGTDFTAVTVGGGFGTDNDERGDVIGFLFTVGDLPISVSAIGFWDADEDRFDVAHDVGIYRQSDMVLIVRSTVAGGVDARLEDQFRYVDIAPTVLPAGASYQVVGYRPPGSVDLVAFNFNEFSVPSRLITFDGGIFLNTPDGLTFATDNPGTRNGIFGTNFQFTVAGDCDPCDMDCDGDVDAFDIEPFLDCLFP